MATMVYTRTTGGPVTEGGLTLDVPAQAVPEGTTVTVRLDKVVPPSSLSANGAAILGLWKIAATPPTVLGQPAQLSHPAIPPRTAAQQQLLVQDQTDAQGMPMPIGWMPMPIGWKPGETTGSVGCLPPSNGVPSSSATWVALVGL